MKGRGAAEEKGMKSSNVSRKGETDKCITAKALCAISSAFIILYDISGVKRLIRLIFFQCYVLFICMFSLCAITALMFINFSF